MIRAVLSLAFAVTFVVGARCSYEYGAHRDPHTLMATIVATVIAAALAHAWVRSGRRS